MWSAKSPGYYRYSLSVARGGGRNDRDYLRSLGTLFEHGFGLERCGMPRVFSDLSFRPTGITTFLENGGQLETAQRIAGHADSRTTKGYDRTATRLELSEIARVRYER